VPWQRVLRPTGRFAERVSPAPRFVVAGGISVCVDVLTLYLLHSWAHTSLFVATTAGYGVSLGVNYLLNHTWVFRASGQLNRRVPRYVALVVVNYVLTVVLVTGLSALGLPYLIAKLIAVGVNAVLNFIAYQRWVFV